MENSKITLDSIKEEGMYVKRNVPVAWSIRGVERDTRAAIEKQLSEQIISYHLDEEIRSLVQGQLI